jgi:hypothetical protein
VGQIKFILTWLIAALLFVRCSTDLAGGGADVGNPVVMGSIVTDSNNPASETEVTLIPVNYNPVEDASLVILQKDTTDSEGRFTIAVKDTGSYNITALHLTQRTRLLYRGKIRRCGAYFLRHC